MSTEVWYKKRVVRYTEQANERGVKLLRLFDQPGIMLGEYLLACGHKKTMTADRVRKGSYECKQCSFDKLKAEGLKNGIQVLGKGEHGYNCTLPCGHNKWLAPAAIRGGKHVRSALFCSLCTSKRHVKEAAKYGAIIVERYPKYGHHRYQLSCGHEKAVSIRNMKRGLFRCKQCGDWAATQPSNLYLFRIECDGLKWLKLGYAKTLEYRPATYGLPEHAEVILEHSIPVDTGRSANLMESAIHKKYKKRRLDPKRMKRYHKSGYTECYPMDMLGNLLLEFPSEKTRRSAC